jgi:hypothetical protein
MSTRNQVPSYTERQLKTFEVLQRTQLARRMFNFLATVFSVILIAALYAIFCQTARWYAIVGLMSTDSIIGVAFAQMVRSLYPDLRSAKDRK